MNHPEPDGPDTNNTDGTDVAVPGEPVISNPAEFVEAFAHWMTTAPPEETGEFIHRLIDHRRSQAAEHDQPPDDAPPADGGIVLGDPDCPDG